ncbi:CGNR zinc finger domain-containing protein, partial [Actinacidiphila alni]|uniref:CGNR zinc finger domain-containing protein n=1 Tax=Actinacidiphila alni TaxID=380248 RepID=UPI0033F40C61
RAVRERRVRSRRRAAPARTPYEPSAQPSARARSPSGRSRWCTMAICGSRAKMRAYRSRTR